MTGQGGPLIVDKRLQPVWVRPVGTNVVSGDLQQETLDGKPVLVWWQGVITHTGATSSGEVKVVDDSSYRNVATVKAQGPTGCSGATCWTISIHDAVIERQQHVGDRLPERLRPEPRAVRRPVQRHRVRRRRPGVQPCEPEPPDADERRGTP